MHELFAQAAEALSGGSGWVGTGLLGTVLGWLLLKHLPDKDKQLEKLIADHLKAEKAQRDSHEVFVQKQRDECAMTMAQQRVEFRETLNVMLDHNRKQVEGLANALKQDLGAMHGTMEAVLVAMRRRRATDDGPSD